MVGLDGFAEFDPYPHRLFEGFVSVDVIAHCTCTKLFFELDKEEFLLQVVVVFDVECLGIQGRCLA